MKRSSLMAACGLSLGLAVTASAQTSLPRPATPAASWNGPRTPCAGLAAAAPADATVTMAADVPAGSFQPPAAAGPPGPGPAASAQPLDVPAFCRVAATLRPAPKSDIKAEVWLPARWNGKFLGVGNAGFAGSIVYNDLAAALRAGYAAVSSDSGHVGGAPGAIAQGGPEALVDYGWRAAHAMTVFGKAMTSAYYGGMPRLSYFAGCSGGGRMALIEAQRFPADYDGVVAGSSAFSYARLTAFDTWKGRTNVVDGKPVLGRSDFELLRKAALAACDKLDGAADVEIADPRACRFKPERLACRPGQAAGDCLSPAQVEMADRLYGGMHDARTGALLAAGMVPGGELAFAGTAQSVAGIGGQFYGQLVFHDPAYDASRIDYGGDVERGDAAVEAIIARPDLAAFARRGGKLIQYASWNEATPTPEDAINYYDTVAKGVGGLEKARIFDRLFIVPNANHCLGGAPGYAAPFFTALEDWVEHGHAPDFVVAERIAAPAAGAPVGTREVVGHRPLCAYPAVQRYRGKGDLEAAESFTCAAAPAGPRAGQAGKPPGA